MTNLLQHSVSTVVSRHLASSPAYDAAQIKRAEITPVLEACEAKHRGPPQEGRGVPALQALGAKARVAAMRELFGPGKRWTWSDAVSFYSHTGMGAAPKYRDCLAEAKRKAKRT